MEVLRGVYLGCKYSFRQVLVDGCQAIARGVPKMYMAREIPPSAEHRLPKFYTAVQRCVDLTHPNTRVVQARTVGRYLENPPTANSSLGGGVGSGAQPRVPAAANATV